MRITSLPVLVACVYLLLSSGVTDADKRLRFAENKDLNVLGRLAWARDVSTLRMSLQDGSSVVGQPLRNILRHAQDDLIQHPELAVVPQIEREGILPTDSRYKASEQAIRAMPVLLRFALCARIAQEPLSIQCRLAGEHSLTRWATTYQSLGNPINDSHFALVFVSLDLLLDVMSPDTSAQMRQWLRSFIDAGDRYFNAKKPSDTSRFNNHNTWRLAMRSLAAHILDDAALISETRGLLAAQVRDDLLPPPGWTPTPACANNAGELAYGSVDFRHRDALHYHVYNLQAWVWLALMTPDAIGSTGRDAVLDALQFLRPYYTGEKTHIEFVCSKVQFDIARRIAGIPEYLNAPWKPERARSLLRLARATFPPIRSWTYSVVDEQYDPWIKTISAIQERYK